MRSGDDAAHHSETTHAEAPNPNDVEAQCATDLGLVALADQVTLALVSDPAVLADAALPPGLSGIAPVGDFVELLLAKSGTATSLDLDQGSPPALFASDEEGGSVQRFGALLGSIPSARRHVDEFTPEQVKQLFVEYGYSLSELGVTMAFDTAEQAQIPTTVLPSLPHSTNSADSTYSRSRRCCPATSRSWSVTSMSLA